MPSPRTLPGLSRRDVVVETRAEGDEEQPVVVGYGAVFYREGDAGTEYELWDDMVERILPGAFDRAIREDDVRSFFNHDPNIILGRNRAETLALSVDETGLRYEATPPTDSPAAQSAVASIRRRDVSGSSFMFVPKRTTWLEVDELFIRQIEEVELWEVGPVAFPAYEATSSELRSLKGDRRAEPYCRWLDAHVEAARRELEAFRGSRRDDRGRRQRRARIAELGR